MDLYKMYSIKYMEYIYCTYINWIPFYTED